MTIHKHRDNHCACCSTCLPCSRHQHPFNFDLFCHHFLHLTHLHHIHGITMPWKIDSIIIMSITAQKKDIERFLLSLQCCLKSRWREHFFKKDIIIQKNNTHKMRFQEELEEKNVNKRVSEKNKQFYCLQKIRLSN